MKILIACEYSGIVRTAFEKKGHTVLSCDLLPTEIPGNHYQGDVLGILNDGWDLMIAHPPCTYLTNTGVCHLYTEPERWKKLIDGAVFFRTLLNANIPKIAIENPIPHKYGVSIIGAGYSQLFQPYHFGHTESKATCLWLKNLPPLAHTNNVHREMKLLPRNQQFRLHWLSPSPDRWKKRSQTFQGIADAMADQWG